MVKSPQHRTTETAETAQGWTLHVTSKNATGYVGVFKQPTGRFHAQRAGTHLGNFATATEAAVAYAQALAKATKSKQDARAASDQQSAADHQRAEHARRTRAVDAQRERVAQAEVRAAQAEAAVVQEREKLRELEVELSLLHPPPADADGASPSDGVVIAAPLPVGATGITGALALSEGLLPSATATERGEAGASHVGTSDDPPHQGSHIVLHRSSSNATGYVGVFKQPTGRFHAQRAGKHLGNFATAIDAAVAYAQAVRAARPDAAQANEVVVHGSAALLQLMAAS